MKDGMALNSPVRGNVKDVCLEIGEKTNEKRQSNALNTEL